MGHKITKIVWFTIAIVLSLTVLWLLLPSPPQSLEPDSEQLTHEDAPTTNIDPVPSTTNVPYPLVNIQDIDATIGIELKYATTDNFTGHILYDAGWGAYLQKDVAEMLSEANKYLHSIRPDLRLLIYDATRPLHVQRRMWEHVKDTPYKNYVANPERTGLHNYGAAVDLTLADSLWTPLDMGTEFDYFGAAAGINHEKELLQQGVLSILQINNRTLLREAMVHAGFLTVSGEWWHFNACLLQTAKQRYMLIN
jgi:D-alanyl-D-alanine dipeptidase